MNPLPPVSEKEQAGIEAIVFLQSLAGVVEPADQALVKWRAMSDYERHMTTVLCELMKSELAKKGEQNG